MAPDGKSTPHGKLILAALLLGMVGCSPSSATVTSSPTLPRPAPTSTRIKAEPTAIPSQPTAPASGGQDQGTGPQRDDVVSPDGRWTASFEPLTGYLRLIDSDGVEHNPMPAGSSATSARWSADSRWLAVVLSSTTGAGPLAPEIWSVDSQPPDQQARYLYSLPQAEYPGPAQIQLGPWSPDDQRLVFWSGPMSASILADGLPMSVLDTLSRQALQISQTSLLNPFYQSWAPDGTELAFTDGGYRSAQIDKNLAIYDVTTRMLNVPVTAQEQVPGTLAWSPDGRWIAYAAVPAEDTGPDWADWMGWDNPAIAGRRIFLLDPTTGEIQRLNNTDEFQDAPAWGKTGSELFYVQADGSALILMKADMATQASSPIQGCQMERPEAAGYYGQPEWETLLDCGVTRPTEGPSHAGFIALPARGMLPHWH